jgi:hypothetical protein
LFVLIRLSLHFLMPVSIPSTTGFCFHQFHLRLQISYSRFFCFRISVGATLPRREPRDYLLALAGLAISFAVPVLAQEQNTVDPEVRQQIEAGVKWEILLGTSSTLPPKVPLQTFHEFTGESIPRSPWAKTFYSPSAP